MDLTASKEKPSEDVKEGEEEKTKKDFLPEDYEIDLEFFELAEKEDLSIEDVKIEKFEMESGRDHLPGLSDKLYYSLETRFSVGCLIEISGRKTKHVYQLDKDNMTYDFLRKCRPLSGCPPDRALLFSREK